MCAGRRAIVINRTQRFLFPIKANVANASLRHELENGFRHSETGAQDRDERDGLRETRARATR